MDPGLRRAWTEIVTAADYDGHMASIGQAQAAADLTRCLIEWASLPAGGSITIAGAGTGQMFDYLDPAVIRPYRLTCSDLNPAFLARLGDRLARRGLDATIVETISSGPRWNPGPACSWPPCSWSTSTGVAESRYSRGCGRALAASSSRKIRRT